MKRILGAALGNCIHVAGLEHFLEISRSAGYSTISLGPSVSITSLIESIRAEKPEIVAVSYRLTPEVADILFTDLKNALLTENLKEVRFIFGGTSPVCEKAKNSGIFDRVFDGSESRGQLIQYLTGVPSHTAHQVCATDLKSRIMQKYPYPVLRHHFGLPSLRETIRGVRTIAESEVLDVISLGPDQNAQEFFFHPEKMDRSQDGAGGVPLRHPSDLETIYRNSRTGNFPLVRCYSGTMELQKWAEMSVRTIHNAWAAIPLCWYSLIDGRSDLTVGEAMREHQNVIRWYAERGIPVEVNESHQWSLREAHDSLAVAMAFLAAYNAKKAGVRDYVAQFMFNTPPGTSASMDIAKMLAKKELMEELEDQDFSIIREVRAGLTHFSPVPEIAQGQLAASTVISLSLKPHIVHVVGYSEGDHAIQPDELINSCNIVHGVLKNCLKGFPDLTNDLSVKSRKEELKKEAKELLEGLKIFSGGTSEDPWSDPVSIEKAIRAGILDAPHLKGNKHACGRITTRQIDGAWYALNPSTGHPWSEKDRLSGLLNKPIIE